jgi:hypothetical protein
LARLLINSDQPSSVNELYQIIRIPRTKKYLPRPAIKLTIMFMAFKNRRNICIAGNKFNVLGQSGVEMKLIN